MKKGLILCLVLGVILINLGSVFADGGYFPPPGYWVRPGEQRAIIFHEDNVETMILTSEFQGNAKDLVWLVPTSSKPEITKANEEIFENILDLIEPKYETQSIGFGKVYSDGAADTNRVLVLESKKVDYYDVNVLFAVDSEDLIEWFNENNYSYPEEYSYVLDHYLDKQWYFTAIKVSSEAQGSTEVIQDLARGHPTPIKMVFKSDKIVFPLKISSIDFKPSEEEYGPAEDEIVGATRKDSNGNTWIKVRIGEPNYGPAKDEPVGAERSDGEGRVWVKQDNGMWELKENPYEDYGKTSWGDILIDQQPGGIRSQDLGGYWTTNANQYGGVEWRDSQIDRQPGGINYVSNYRYDNYVPISLFIISDGKYESGKFQTTYGNWFEKDIIQNLGYDDNGDPFLQPKKEKYYLTHLYAPMEKSEMDDDVFFQKSNNDNKVNTGLELWQIFIYGLLVVVAIIIVWILTPLGWMFIAGTLFLSLSSKRVARIFGWILQGVSLAITILIGLL